MVVQYIYKKYRRLFLDYVVQYKTVFTISCTSIVHAHLQYNIYIKYSREIYNISSLKKLYTIFFYTVIITALL